MPLIGCEHELNHLRALLTTSGVELVMSNDVGGSGKSHLALHLGKPVLADMPAGSVCVDRALLHNSAEIACTIAQACGLNYTDLLTAQERLIALLNDHRLLLVFA